MVHALSQFVTTLPILPHAKVLLLSGNGGKVKDFTPQNSFLEDLRF